MFNDKLYFILEKKELKDVLLLMPSFAIWLKQSKIEEISINLNNIFEFFIAFFATSSLNIKCHINSDFGYILDDESFKKIKLKKTDEKIVINKNFNFFVRTSGSTAKSKSIQKSIKQMFSEAKALNSFLNLKDLNFYSSVSHLHLFGLTFKVFLPLVSGGKVYSAVLNYPESLYDIDFKNSIYITSPTILNVISKHDDLSNLSELKLMITAGSKLKEKVRSELLDKFKVDIMEIYGSSESGVVARNFGDGFELFDDVSVSITKENQLLISSPWCDEFLSSDTGMVDGKKLTLFGRADRIVKLNDYRFHLDEAEEWLESHKFIKDTKCALLDDETRVSTLIVLSDLGKCEFLKGGKKAITTELKSFCKDKFKTNLRHFKIVEEIKYNQNGKFSKNDFVNSFCNYKKPLLKRVDEKNSNGEYKFELYMSEELFFYEGHFNNYPITPGFIELGLIYDALNELGFNIDDIISIKNIKFTALLRPFERITLTLKQEKNRVECKIEGKTRYASARVVFRGQNE